MYELWLRTSGWCFGIGIVLGRREGGWAGFERRYGWVVMRHCV